MTLRIHISSHNDDLHNTTAKRNSAGGVAGLDTSGNVENTSGNDCETVNNKDAANGYVALNASSKMNSNLLDIPILDEFQFRTNAGTGTAYNPSGLNDNNFVGNVSYSNINEYVEVDLGNFFIITKFRQYGNTWNVGDGRFKIQYHTGAAWADLITGIATRSTADWSGWTKFSSLISTDKIRLVCTTVDTNGLAMSLIRELQITI